MDDRQFALEFQREFTQRTRIDLQLAALFYELPTAAFFIKDRQSRFVRANARLLRILGRAEEWEILGKTDLDFRPPQVATVYLQEDDLVMSRGNEQARSTQLVPDVDGEVNWYLTTKMPLRDHRGAVCGLAGVMYETREIGGTMQPFHRIEPALRHIHQHYGEAITTRNLAELVHLSERQFLRLFTEALGEGPMRHLVRQRIQAACQALIATDQAAGTIAIECGFYDQSAFNRAFRSVTGVTPSTYRIRHQDQSRPIQG